MDPRVREVIETLQKQVLNIQTNSGDANQKAVEPAEKLSTEELALSVNLSESRLRTLFKADTGVTPNRYLKKLKMEKAKEMAETRHLRVTKILTTLDVGDHSHFKRDFKRKFGLTLAECRKRR